jgi:aminoglycoside phosphotransferase (APT) family kinase protein
LVEQIDDYLVLDGTTQALVHADLHADHLFVDGGRLVGVIDWGDALIADPFYELPALHLGSFAANHDLLNAFLAGYGWRVGSDFARRAMSMTLIHEFNVLAEVETAFDFARYPSLEALASDLWRLR